MGDTKTLKPTQNTLNPNIDLPLPSMTHQPHFDHYTTTFSAELHHDFPTPSAAAGEATAVSGGGHHASMWNPSHHFVQSYPLPFFDDHQHHMGLPENDMFPQVPMMVTSESHRGAMDMAVPVFSGDCYDMHAGFYGGVQSYEPAAAGSFYDLVDDDRFKSISPCSEDNWVNQGSQITTATEDSNTKVGRYTVEERKDRILRYLKKRNQRNFNKTIKYACRKTLADRRVRIRGRFARNNELSEEEETMTKKNDHLSAHKESDLFFSDEIQVKHDDEDWLEDMASIMYLPYFSG